jgi:hypothetical protein
MAVTAKHRRLSELLARKPVVLAPMEDVTDVVFRPEHVADPAPMLEDGIAEVRIVKAHPDD